MRKKGKIKKTRVLLVLLIFIVFFYSVTKIFEAPQAVKMDNSITEEKKEIVAVFPDEVYGVPVKTELVELGTDGRPGTKREIKYIVLHETGNFERGTDAECHSLLLTENSQDSTSWHYTVDDHEIYHHIPDDEIAWHAGDGSKPDGGNTCGIGIELCVNEDGDFEKTFDNAARLVAYLLNAYELYTSSIKKHGDFISKDCPNSIIKNNRMGEFVSKVEEYLAME